MSTSLRLLYLAFWMHPIQRYCTVVGFGVMAGLGATLYSPAPLSARLAGWGFFIGLLPPLLLGGAFWRALAAPRAISLAPWGRLRLLAGVAAIAALIPVAATVCAALVSLGISRSPGLFATQASWMLESMRMALFPLAVTAPWIGLWLVASFVASRSPLATLLVVVTCIIAVYVLWRFDIIMNPGSPRAWLMREWGSVPPLAVCALFATWFLVARRVRPPGWLLPGGQSVLAAVALAESSSSVIGQRAALERLLLGGSSVSRLLIQWLIIQATLLFLLMLTVWLESDPDQARIVAHIAFASLVLLPAIVAAQSLAMVRRARALWLASGFSRAQLYAFVGRTLLKFTLGMATLFAALLLLLWNTQPWHPELTVAQVPVLSLLPGLFATACALRRPGGQMFYWPAVALVLWFAAWCPLTESWPATWSGTSGLLCNALAVAAVLLQVALAPGRWQADDLPRAATSR